MSTFGVEPHLHLYPQPSPTEAAEPGWNAVFALWMRACPAERVDGDERPVVARRLVEQADLVKVLCRPDATTAFALRYITRPDPQRPALGSVEVALLARVLLPTRDEAAAKARALAAEVLALLRGAVPGYEWEAATTTAGFQALWSPFPLVEAHVAEIRRREDRLPLQTPRAHPSLGLPAASYALQPLGPEDETYPPIEADAEDSIYFVNPFVARLTTWSRILRVMLQHPHPVLWQAALAPVVMTEAEREGLSSQIARCEALRQGTGSEGEGPYSAPNVPHLAHAQAVGTGLLNQWLRLRSAPCLLNVSVASRHPLPGTLVEAIGNEITEPVGDEDSFRFVSAHLHRGGFDVVWPESAQEKADARSNVGLLSFKAWGASLAPPGLRRLRYLMDATEAVAAFRLPVATAEGLAGLRVRRARHRPLPREAAASSGSGIVLGVNTMDGGEQPVFLSDEDRRQHLYVVGQTGTGKTTLLRQMILADMAAGKGLAVLDPHGDLFEDLLAHIPQHRLKDVVIVDPSDLEFPVGLNMLECREAQDRHGVAREIRGIIERLLDDQYQQQASTMTGPLFYQHVQMNLLLAMSNPDDPGTLLEFSEIFSRKDYWKRWLPLRWDEPRLARWVADTLPGQDYARAGSEGVRLGQYFASKFEDFVVDARLRLIFAQKRSTIDVDRVMAEGKILLVNLAKGILGEANSRFLGMVLMAKIQAAAMRRAKSPQAERRMFYLYVDEFQSIATENFVVLLSEARKFGVSLVLANQFLSQVRDGRIVQAVFGNVGTLVCFRTGREDAEQLAKYVAPYVDAADLASLPNWEACVRATVGGQVLVPFSLRTLAPAGGGSEATAVRVRYLSRRRYGRPRAQVEAEVARSLLSPETPAAVPAGAPRRVDITTGRLVPASSPTPSVPTTTVPARGARPPHAALSRAQLDASTDALALPSEVRNALVRSGVTTVDRFYALTDGELAALGPQGVAQAHRALWAMVSPARAPHLPVASLELSVRSRKLLERMGVSTAAELAQVTERDLLAQRNSGQTSVNEIKQALAALGMALREAGDCGCDPFPP